MAKPSPYNPVPVSDLVSEVLDPVMRRRAGISVALVQSWEEIVGPRIANASRPHRIVWPRRARDNDPFEPATLEIACNGLAALHIQHQTGEIITRVNGFLGFSAVGRIKLLQKPVSAAQKPARTPPPPLSAPQAAALLGRLQPIEDEALRAALERLGRSVLAQKSGKDA